MSFMKVSLYSLSVLLTTSLTRNTILPTSYGGPLYAPVMLYPWSCGHTTMYPNPKPQTFCCIHTSVNAIHGAVTWWLLMRVQNTPQYVNKGQSPPKGNLCIEDTKCGTTGDCIMYATTYRLNSLYGTEYLPYFMYYRRLQKSCHTESQTVHKNNTVVIFCNHILL